jgi:hypothetical protein
MKVIFNCFFSEINKKKPSYQPTHLLNSSSSSAVNNIP